MEKRIITKVSQNTYEYKQVIINEILRVKNTEWSLDDLVQFIYKQDPTPLDKGDFIKRKRAKNCVPMEDRCVAKRANNDQCTRRKKDLCLYCGTHSKGVPHGIITEDESRYSKKNVWAEDIHGIIYYIDADHLIYKTEDIMKNLVNPTIIGKWSKVGDTYMIHRNI